MRVRASLGIVLCATVSFGIEHTSYATGRYQVSGGGILVEGWQGNLDKNDAPGQQPASLNDIRLVSEGTGYRLTTGPAGMFWNPVNSPSGDFTVRATFTEPIQKTDHPHPFGLFVGGSGLDTDEPTALYCVAYRDGTFLVRQFVDGKASTVVSKTPHVSVAKVNDPTAPATQEIEWNVHAERLECTINGAVVWSAPRSEIIGAGKLESTDGIVGIRVSQDVDVLVSNWNITQ